MQDWTVPEVSETENLPVDVAYRAAFLLADQYLDLEKDPDEGLVLFHQYLQSDPARWHDWLEAVKRARAGAGINPLADNVADAKPAVLSFLPTAVIRSAHVESNGEVLWSLADAGDAIHALAAAGRVVLGTDLRDYAPDGTFVEVAWSSYEGASVTAGRDAALAALGREHLPGTWVLVTWAAR